MSTAARRRDHACTAGAGAPTLLLADDNDGVREVLRLHAESRGLRVVGEAVDGRDAVELAERLRPDAIILDQEMPRMPGLAALRLLRHRTPCTVVVMYASDPSIESAALGAGAAAYFSKGHSPREVMLSVLELLASRGRSPAARHDG